MLAQRDCVYQRIARYKSYVLLLQAHTGTHTLTTTANKWGLAVEEGSFAGWKT